MNFYTLLIILTLLTLKPMQTDLLLNIFHETFALRQNKINILNFSISTQY